MQSMDVAGLAVVGFSTLTSSIILVFLSNVTASFSSPYLSVRDYFPIEVSGCCLRVAFSGVRLLSELTAGVKKSFTGTAKDTLHL